MPQLITQDLKLFKGNKNTSKKLKLTHVEIGKSIGILFRLEELYLDLR
jgi:hypothetical protein